MTDVLGELTQAGVSVWLDDISRERLRTGNLEALVRDFHVRGVTSNPTIFANALAKGDAYDEQIKDLAIRGVTVDEASRMITTYDIRWGADVLRGVYDSSDGVDGRVSIEVDPRLARETDKTIPRPSSCGGWSTGRTCTSRSRRPRRASRRSPRRSPRGSRST
jgi:transaldolase